MTEYTHSVVSGAELEPLFSLGNIYVSDFLKPGEHPKGAPCELALSFDPVSKIAQLTKQPDASLMWGSMYYYRSAVNPAMVSALKDLAEKTVSCAPIKDNSVYLDIATNDGTLLEFVNNKFKTVGIDPSDYPESLERADLIIKDYFSKEVYSNSGIKKADRVSCAAMFYDLNNPEQFLKDVFDIMEDDGVFVLQLSYTPLMLKQLEFGNICHEHLCYYNLTSLKYLFDKTNFVIKDIELNNVNGGSIRVYLQKNTAPNNFLGIADKDVCDIRIKSLLEWEENNGYNSNKVYLDFFDKIKSLKDYTVKFIKEKKNQGLSVWGFGASTKGNTLLQFFCLDNTILDGIVEKQQCKVGRRTIGSNIPIFSEQDFRAAKPEYCLVLPWFFSETFKTQEKDYLKSGTFIFPAPEFSLYTEK